MDEYSALAQRTAVSVPEVRGCLILSRDGLVLGAYPDDDEAPAKAAWLRFCVLGEPERSFIEFTDQTWAFVKRGPYAAFAVAEPGVRPGILVDQLEQALLVAEETRVKREAVRVPDTQAAPSGKPRTSLHPPDRTSSVEVGAERRPPFDRTTNTGPVAERAPLDEEADRRRWGSTPPSSTTVPAARGGISGTEPGADSSAVGRWEPQRLVGAPSEGTDEEDFAEADGDAEVDRVLLAKEFSGLLQMDPDDDEGSS